MPNEKCTFCGKTVYAAELRRYDGMAFHALCHGKWKKQQEAADSAKRNIEFVVFPHPPHQNQVSVFCGTT